MDAIVNTNLTGELSLVDKVWNDAMETSALRCEDTAQHLRSANGDSDAWVWPAANMFIEQAKRLRELKRAPPPPPPPPVVSEAMIERYRQRANRADLDADLARRLTVLGRRQSWVKRAIATLRTSLDVGFKDRLTTFGRQRSNWVEQAIASKTAALAAIEAQRAANAASAATYETMTKNCLASLPAYKIERIGASPRIIFYPCETVSSHPKDVAERYCARCHRFVTEPMVVR